jgi:uncharacterized membrane protein
LKKTPAKKRDRLFLLLILIAVIYVAFWVGYAGYKYNSLQSSWFDIGAETFSFYYHIKWPQNIGGLQFLSFAEHIDPFELAILPFFSLYPSPITLLIIQDVALAAAALVIYLIGRNVIGNRYIGFALAIAFLINPGVNGITIYDFHPEAFIPLFCILSFYFYMRSKKSLFVIETSITVGISILLAFALYEIFYSTDDRKRMLKSNLKLIGICAIITILFFLFYYFVLNSLSLSYAAGAYPNMPSQFRVVNFFGSQLKTLLSPPKISQIYPANYFILLALTGIAILLLGFGFHAIRRIPIIALILISPWLFEVFLLHNPIFPTLVNEYYAYALGGAVIAACLGIITATKKANIKPLKASFDIILIALLILIYASSILLPAIPQTNPLKWSIKNSTTASIGTATLALNTNSSIMSQPSIAAHLYRFEGLEMPPDVRLYAFTQSGFIATNVSFYSGRPDYIMLDKNLSDYGLMNGSAFNVYAYMGDNYTLCSSANGIELYSSGKPC